MLITMQKITIDGELVTVDDKLTGFTIHSKPSTNVEYFGSSNKSEVFVQFKSGSSFIYTGVSPDLITKMERASSIGAFIAEMIVKPNIYPSIKYPHRLVQLESKVITGSITDEGGNDVW
jgi:hypothetical protein